MAKSVEIEQLIPTLEALASAGGVSVLLILAALRNAAIWEVVGGGIGGIDPRTISAEGRGELHSALGEILAGVMSRVKEGDLAAALVASSVATQRAALR
jgi:hypothetical protein